ncbi:MAG: hypothetical protein HY564_02455 [Candidatus Jacksonbacteria bacterium]|nr:hypothetical protein [Candidatus Jacksonbacteria bacterium]
MLIEEKSIIQEEGFLHWWQEVVFFKALNRQHAWEMMQVYIPRWYNHAEKISPDHRRKRFVLNLPIRGEVVLVMREVK